MSSSDHAFVVLGDLHGDLGWARRAVRSAAEAGASRIFQVGDAGFCWPGRDKYKFDRRLSVLLNNWDMELVFVDGNHDAHPELRRLDVGEDGLAKLREGIFYLPRGTRIEYGGLAIGGLGGAYSIDKEWRTLGKDWWPEEEVCLSDVDRLLAKGRIDVLLTHEVPFRFTGLQGDPDLPLATIEQANVSRRLIQKAVDVLKPRYVFSGHWHQRRVGYINHEDGTITRVDVLDMNGSRDGHAVHVSVRPDGVLKIMPLMVT